MSTLAPPTVKMAPGVTCSGRLRPLGSGRGVPGRRVTSRPPCGGAGLALPESWCWRQVLRGAPGLLLPAPSPPRPSQPAAASVSWLERTAAVGLRSRARSPFFFFFFWAPSLLHQRRSPNRRPSSPLSLPRSDLLHLPKSQRLVFKPCPLRGRCLGLCAF